jgi:hypothetical protein
MKTAARSADILRRLAAHEVEFIVVDMTAGVLQGTPVTTFDLDIVHRRTTENIERLLRVLAELDAVYRNDARNLRPTRSYLESPGYQLLRTSLGDMDCLGTIDDGKSYEDLLLRTVPLSLGEGVTVRALELSALIEAKERAARPKDLAVLPYLRATLDEIRRRS